MRPFLRGSTGKATPEIEFNDRRPSSVRRKVEAGVPSIHNKVHLQYKKERKRKGSRVGAVAYWGGELFYTTRLNQVAKIHRTEYCEKRRDQANFYY